MFIKSSHKVHLDPNPVHVPTKTPSLADLHAKAATPEKRPFPPHRSLPPLTPLGPDTIRTSLSARDKRCDMDDIGRRGF